MPIIKNYGLRWVRDKVEWGSKGVAGSLRGRRVSARQSESVDFKEQIGIYVLYEQGFVPVYVGQAGFGNADLMGRLRHHRNDHLRDRWAYFSWFGFRAVNADGSLSQRNNAGAVTSIRYADALDEMEGILIQVLEPRLNKQGARWQQTAEEYVQSGRADEGDRVEQIDNKLDEILRTLEKIKKL